MSPVALYTALLAAAALRATAQSNAGCQALASKSFPYDQIPYKADTCNGVRGPQWGYNRCNSTTEGQDSLCQTALINAIDDFCLWGPPEGPATIGDSEGEAVAYCNKPGKGTRLIPAGTISGMQFTRTPDYIQIVGFLDQTKIGITKGDSGGEMDGHGADLRGNPMGGLVYSNAWSNGNNNSYIQAPEWHNFIGNDYFCFKVCDPSKPNDARYCEHIFDRIGCMYNAPSAAKDGEFTACKGDNQDFPGIYTDASGAVQTYTQPPESLGPITTMPYQPKVPASSECVTYRSEDLFAAVATVLPSGSSAASASTATSTSGASTSRSTGTSSRGTGTSSASSPAASETGNGNGALSTACGSLFGVISAAFVMVLLA